MSRDVASLSSYLQEVCEQPSLGHPPLNITSLIKHRKGAERCVNVLKTRQNDWSVSTPKQMIGATVSVIVSATLTKKNSQVDSLDVLDS